MAKKRKIVKKTALLRHKLALKIISENVGDPSVIKKELLKLGYSESYLNSGRLKNTKSWQNLVDEYFPDKDLARIHQEGLKAELVKTATHEGRIMDERKYPDFQTRHKYLDSAYKLKKKYGDETIIHKLGLLSNEDIEGEIAGAISEALGSIAGAKKKKGK